MSRRIMATWLGGPAHTATNVAQPCSDDDDDVSDVLSCTEPLFLSDGPGQPTSKKPCHRDQLQLQEQVPVQSVQSVQSVQQPSPRRSWTWVDFNAEQLSFIQKPLEQDGKLFGVPGGGKTRTILGRLAWWIDRGAMRHDDGFLLLTFNRAACADLVAKAADMLPGLVGRHSIRTVHSVAGSVTSKLKSTTTLSQDVNTVIVGATRLCQGADQAALRGVACLRHVQTIIVDEAQDINEAQYAFIVSLGRGLGASVVLVGDPNQNIYQFQGGSDKFLRQHPGFTVTLTKNYRSTPALVRLIDAVRPVPYGTMEAVRPDLDDHDAGMPTLVSGTQEDVAAAIVARVQEALGHRVTVAIIGPVKKCLPSPVGDLINMGLQWTAQLLRDAQIPCRLHYTEGDADHEQRPQATKKRKTRTLGSGADDVDSDGIRDPSVVHLLTVHGSKGLEFDDVLVLNYHHASMGRVPASEARAREFEYLWYVALSRARSRMTVYHFEQRAVWPGFHRRKLTRHVTVRGNVPVEKELRALPPTDPLPSHWALTELLQNRLVCTEPRLYQAFQDLELVLEPLPPLPRGVGDDVQAVQALDVSALPLFDEISAVYGLWAENTFYHAYRGQAPPCLTTIQTMLASALYVEPPVARSIVQLQRALGMADVGSGLIEWSCLEVRRTPDVARSFGSLLAWLDTVRAARPDTTHVFVVTQNAVQWFDEDALHQLCRTADAAIQRGHPLAVCDVWRMCLFLWQLKAEAGWRWHQDYDAVYAALDGPDARIRAWARALPDGWVFQHPVDLAHLPIHGVADAVHPTSDDNNNGGPATTVRGPRVLELKFSMHPPNLHHALQATCYAEMWQRCRVPDVQVEVWNIWSGQRARVQHTSCPQRRWRFYRAVADMIQQPLHDTMWMYDLETTGVDVRTCGITDIHLEELTTGLVPLSTLVHQAEVPADVQALTGITPELLRTAPPVREVMSTLIQVVAQCDRPTLAAFNGYRFDHPILRRFGTLAEVYWVDPLALFCALRPIKTANNRLGTLYEAIMGAPYPGQAHRAAADVDMMLRMCRALDVSASTLRLSAKSVHGDD